MQSRDLNNANPLHPEREIANRNRDERNHAMRRSILGYIIPLMCITVPIGAFVYDLTRPSENAILAKHVELLQSENAIHTERVEVLAKRIEQLESENAVHTERGEVLAKRIEQLESENAIHTKRGEVLAKRVDQLQSENEDLRIDVGKMQKSLNVSLMTLATEFNNYRVVKGGRVKFLKSVPLKSYPVSVGHWREQTFVGLNNNKLASIDSSYRVNPSFITFNNQILAIEVYNDRLYTLVNGDLCTIYVHDMQGNLVNSWNHTDCGWYTGLAIVSEQVVVPDLSNKYLRIYSLSGSLIESISCSQLSQHHVSLCALGADSVIVSHHGSSQVFRMNISSGEVMWTCKDIVRPEAVTSYGQRYILVAAQGSSTLRVLDSTTGKIVSGLTDNAISGVRVYDMCITGDTLIVVNFSAETVVYYQLLGV